MNPAQISHLVSLSPDVPPPTFPVKVPFVKMDRCNKIVKKKSFKHSKFINQKYFFCLGGSHTPLHPCGRVQGPNVRTVSRVYPVLSLILVF